MLSQRYHTHTSLLTQVQFGSCRLVNDAPQSTTVIARVNFPLNSTSTCTRCDVVTTFSGSSATATARASQITAPSGMVVAVGRFSARLASMSGRCVTYTERHALASSARAPVLDPPSLPPPAPPAPPAPPRPTHRGRSSGRRRRGRRGPSAATSLSRRGPRAALPRASRYTRRGVL